MLSPLAKLEDIFHGDTEVEESVSVAASLYIDPIDTKANDSM
jgi:hypothetical protein